MTNTMHSQNIPHDSLITQGFGTISYADTFKVSCKTCNSIDSITAAVFSVPNWISILLNGINAIARRLGLKTDIIISKTIPQKYILGERAIYFTIINRNDTEIIMEEYDRHLRFRVSVLARKECSTIHLTTIVHYNNRLGKIYFSSIKPFHKIIIPYLLKKTAKSMN